MDSSRSKDDFGDLPDFRGLTVCVYFSGRPLEEGLYVIDPYFKVQGNRLFLIGTTAVTSELSNHTIGIAWEKVDGYIVADSVEDFLRARESGSSEK